MSDEVADYIKCEGRVIRFYVASWLTALGLSCGQCPLAQGGIIGPREGYLMPVDSLPRSCSFHSCTFLIGPSVLLAQAGHASSAP